MSHDDTTDTTDMTDTADIEQRVRSAAAASRTAGVEVIECDPDLADTAAFCEAYGYSPEDSANAIVVKRAGWSGTSWLPAIRPSAS